jgi:mRNA-degrading endonuclease RelE of RelBE toxin-antitoxin system
MTMFTVLLSDDAEKYYRRVDRKTAVRLVRGLALLEVDPFGGGDIKPVQGRAGVLRLRVGSYRLFFGVDLAARTATVYQIMPRGDAFKQRR